MRPDRGFVRTSRFVPSVLACIAAYAVLVGASGIAALTVTDRLGDAAAYLLLASLCGAIGGAHLLQSWLTIGDRARALRRWSWLQAAAIVALAWHGRLPIEVLAASAMAAVATMLFLESWPYVGRKIVAALLLTRAFVVIAAVLLTSQEMDCLITADWARELSPWDGETNANAQSCRDLWENGQLRPSALALQHLPLIAVTAAFLLLEWLGLWTWKRFANRHVVADAPTNIRAAPRLLRDGIVAVTPITLGCVLIGVWPVEIGGQIGTFPVVLVGLAVWTVFLTWLFIEVPVALGVGPWPLAMPLWLLLVSPWTDNHRMPDAPEAPPTAVAGAEVVRSPECDGNPHPLLCERFLQWDRRRAVEVPQEPVYLVVTSGGGIRAAYWTAMLLARFEDASCGALSRSTFAISGVSGGSVGASIFLAAALHTRAIRTREATCSGKAKDTTDLVERFFRHDLMAPLVASMLFPDAAQRLIPAAWTNWSGRGVAFEAALEAAWRGSAGTDTLARPFLALFPQDAQGVPLLLLASTSVEDGFRVISSPVDPQDPLAYWLQSPDYATRGLRLSTAAHNSARFPFVSPPGRVEHRHGGLLMRIVDGGYFENSSASTGRIALRAIAQPAQLAGRSVSVLLIENDPAADYVAACVDANARSTASSAELPMQSDPSSFAFELGAVFHTLLNTRSARAPWHQSEIEQVSCGHPHVGVLRMFFKDPDRHRAPRPEPAMSWYLSEQSKAIMRRRSEEATGWVHRRLEQKAPFPPPASWRRQSSPASNGE